MLAWEETPMRAKKTYWYRTQIPRESGIYWVDFCFYQFEKFLGDGTVRKVVFKKRLHDFTQTENKHILHGLWHKKERIIYINPATKNLCGAHIPLASILIHELYHALDSNAQEYCVEEVEVDLWELSTERQKEFLRRYLRRQWKQ